MPRHHTVGRWTAERGYYQESVAFTAAEETARDAEIAQAALDESAEESAATVQEAARQRGVDKLTALGLTSDEIAALLQ